MALVTAAEVAAITGIDAASAVMTPAITVADLMVTEDLAGSTLTSDRKKQIELYLAAHFATLSNDAGPLAGETLGEAKETYHNIYASGLRATRFGQQAILLDTTGALAALADSVENPGKKKALMTVVGTPTSDAALDY